MKNFITYFFFCCSLLLTATTSFAQKNSLSTGNAKAISLYYEASRSANEGNYLLAVDKYKQAIQRDKFFVEAYWGLADMYSLQKKDNLRISTLKSISYNNYPENTQTLYRLGIAYFESGQYEEAKTYFVKAQSNKNAGHILTGRINDYIKRSDFAINLKKKPVPFSPRNLGENINSEFDDYWPSITANEDFLSLTVLVGKREGESALRSGIHEDLYVSRKVENKWSKSENIGDPVNTPGNEGAQSFSPDGRYMFFVACDRNSGLGGCDIYYSIRTGNHWSQAINPGSPLNSRYWETTPSMSPAGDELFFASNRPGGKGLKDIWSCSVKIKEDGTLQFGEVKNLGDSINTEMDEFCPFIHADNKTLYFSSNGHFGMGGYDVFFSKRQKSEASWSTPVNLGYPLNTHKDEIGFVVNGAGNKAYFSSDGIEARGRGREIYEVLLPISIRPGSVKFIHGKVADSDMDMPVQAIIEIYTTDSIPEQIFETISDKETGAFTALLPQEENPQEYGFIVRKKDYLFHSDRISIKDTVINVNAVKEIDLERIEVGKSIILKNVFFDFDSYQLKPESYAELEKLVDFLKVNSRVSIELAGHTDHVGHRDHNITLSQNRADVVMEFLKKKGINPTRLTSKGYGQDKPIADNSTSEGRALNRRTEVIITKR